MTADPSATHVVVAMPAYNEADGIGGFLREFDVALQVWPGGVSFVVVDDVSTDDTLGALEAVRPDLSASLHVVHNDVNAGHGPTTVTALRTALELEADLVVQMDGDGQFVPAEIVPMLRQAASDADVVQGVRRNREDPWFRRALSLALRSYLRLGFGVHNVDPNCPLRVYRADTLRTLLKQLPPSPMVPTVYLSVLAGQQVPSLAFTTVTHRVRRGEVAQGSTWGARERRILVPRRLIDFVRAALRESVTFRRSLDRT